MYSLDTNINLSVERANERRQAVQAQGGRRGTETAAYGETSEGTATGRLALRFVTALLVVGLLVAFVVVL
jgi:hypothetical protein